MGRWMDALKTIPPSDKTDITDITQFDSPPHEVLSVKSVLSEPITWVSVAEIKDTLPDHVQPRPNPVRDIMERLEGDMEAYAVALRVHGPMSYGQAMDVLGWGATRAGTAESDLQKAGRISFNKLGRAVLRDIDGDRHER